MNTSNKFHLNETLEVNILIADFRSCIVTIALSTVDSLPCRRFFYKAYICNNHSSRISMLHKNFDFQRQVPLFLYLFRRGIACKVSICVLCRTYLYSCNYLFPMNQVTVDSMQSYALIIIHFSFTWRPVWCKGVLVISLYSPAKEWVLGSHIYFLHIMSVVCFMKSPCNLLWVIPYCIN